MSKTTAVDYLVKEFSDILGAITTKPMQDLLIVDAVNKAKKLEREQHSQTWDNAIEQLEKRGGVKERALVDFDEYFNEKYNGK